MAHVYESPRRPTYNQLSERSLNRQAGGVAEWPTLFASGLSFAWGTPLDPTATPAGFCPRRPTPPRTTRIANRSKWLPALDGLRTLRPELPRAAVAPSANLRRVCDPGYDVVASRGLGSARLVLRAAYRPACSRANAFCTWVKSGLIRNACCKCSNASAVLPCRPKATPRL